MGGIPTDHPWIDQLHPWIDQLLQARFEIGRDGDTRREAAAWIDAMIQAGWLPHPDSPDPYLTAQAPNRMQLVEVVWRILDARKGKTGKLVGELIDGLETAIREDERDRILDLATDPARLAEWLGLIEPRVGQPAPAVAPKLAVSGRVSQGGAPLDDRGLPPALALPTTPAGRAWLVYSDLTEKTQVYTDPGQLAAALDQVVTATVIEFSPTRVVGWANGQENPA